MKITKLAVILVLVGSLALGGCARIALYDNAQLQGPEVGVKFYYSKPYVLVARTEDKDNPVQVAVVYLPDQSKPVYAKLNSGFGSAKLSLAFGNGILTSIGQETDTKIPETITALTGLATAAAGLKAAGLKAGGLKAALPEFKLYEIDNSSGTTILKEVR